MELEFCLIYIYIKIKIEKLESQFLVHLQMQWRWILVCHSTAQTLLNAVPSKKIVPGMQVHSLIICQE